MNVKPSEQPISAISVVEVSLPPAFLLFLLVQVMRKVQLSVCSYCGNCIVEYEKEKNVCGIFMMTHSVAYHFPSSVKVRHHSDNRDW